MKCLRYRILYSFPNDSSPRLWKSTTRTSVNPNIFYILFVSSGPPRIFVNNVLLFWRWFLKYVYSVWSTKRGSISVIVANCLKIVWGCHSGIRLKSFSREKTDSFSNSQFTQIEVWPPRFVANCAYQTVFIATSHFLRRISRWLWSEGHAIPPSTRVCVSLSSRRDSKV